MESVDYQYGLCCSRGVVGRQHLGRKALSAAVDRSHFEVVELSRLQAHVHLALRADIRSVVETGITHSGIYDISGRLGGRLLRITHGIPAEPYLVVILKLYAEIIGSQRCYDIGTSVLVVDVSQNGFVD